MKHARQLFLTILVVMTFFVTGCGTDEQADFPDIGIPVENLNQYLKITAPALNPSFQTGNQIILSIENLSQTAVLIEPGVDVKIFKKSEIGWEAVANKIDYHNSKWSVPVRGGDVPGIRVLDIYPGLKTLMDPITLRVIVIGKPQNLPDVTNTISYMDITVNP